MPTPAADTTDLYRQLVLDHSRHPRNRRRPARYNRDAEGHNTLCGDKVRVYLQVTDDMLEDIAFEATGCAICLASASMMTEAVRFRPIPEAAIAIDQFNSALTRTDGGHLTGDLAALAGVSAYPSRVRCATLPWEALRAALGAALSSSAATVTTQNMSQSR